MERESEALSRQLDRLSRSRFRSRFVLKENDLKYIQEKGLDNIMGHARRFVGRRLVPASPMKDGSQTPMKGHPVFIAQHATATCCRSCLNRWHGIEKGVNLTEAQVTQVLELIRAWLMKQISQAQPFLDGAESGPKLNRTQEMLFPDDPEDNGS